jgi:hypothetical protein
MNLPQSFFLFALFISLVFILDAYGFKEKAEDLLAFEIVFLFGLGVGAWFL